MASKQLSRRGKRSKRATRPNPILQRLEENVAEIRKLLDARTAKRPLIIEFSGSPKSGKTTAINVLSLFFRRNGFKVETFAERASVSPVYGKKGHPDFNIWVSCASLLGMIESVEKNIDIFILDRGLFDALVWNELLARTGKITRSEADTIAAFFTLDRWMRLVDLVCVMKCKPSVSLEREYAHQLTTKRGTIMIGSTLKELNAAIDEALMKFGPKFKKTVMVDTSRTKTREGAIDIASETLEALHDFLNESLCVLRRPHMPIALPEKGFVHDPKAAKAFIEAIKSAGEFAQRSKAEYDQDCLIPIPCAIVIFGKKILILKRKEEGHALHDTYAIWAGGHVFRSDNHNPNIILRCLKRELMEELYIQGQYTLEPIGLVRTNQDERSSRHVGVVFKAKISNPHVALALDQKEFRETRGTSVSGTLINQTQLKHYFNRMGDWSKFIVEKLWPAQARQS